nr:hypothetical protein [Metabacillus idriensis]
MANEWGGKVVCVNAIASGYGYIHRSPP